MRNYVLSVLICSGILLSLFFTLTPGASVTTNEKVIFAFQGGADGQQPASDLTQDASGILYGITLEGGDGGSGCGSQGCGTVFSLSPTKSGWKHQVLYAFSSDQDGLPSGGLTLDKAGNLYGTSFNAGRGGCHDGCGEVFELFRHGNSWAKQTIYTFTGGYDGSNPEGDLVFDSKGNLFGATRYGGSPACQFGYSKGCGVAFKLTPHATGSWTETTLHQFAGSPDGNFPSSGVSFDKAGNAYGATSEGGGNTSDCSEEGGCGVVYKLAPNVDGTWTESVLYAFYRHGGQGIDPSAPVFPEPGGKVAGTTLVGGNGYGTVFELQESPKGEWLRQELHLFYGNPDGGWPVGKLIADAKGNLFGATTGRGYRFPGTVFMVETSNQERHLVVLHSFSGGSDGASPSSGLLLGANGLLYGTTSAGGGNQCGQGCGTVYEVAP